MQSQSKKELRRVKTSNNHNEENQPSLEIYFKNAVAEKVGQSSKNAKPKTKNRPNTAHENIQAVESSQPEKSANPKFSSMKKKVDSGHDKLLHSQSNTLYALVSPKDKTSKLAEKMAAQKSQPTLKKNPDANKR